MLSTRFETSRIGVRHREPTAPSTLKRIPVCIILQAGTNRWDIEIRDRRTARAGDETVRRGSARIQRHRVKEDDVYRISSRLCTQNHIPPEHVFVHAKVAYVVYCDAWPAKTVVVTHSVADAAKHYRNHKKLKPGYDVTVTLLAENIAYESDDGRECVLDIFEPESVGKQLIIGDLPDA